MPLLVVAAIDQTGLVIHLLTAGLIAIAVALVLLTIWYWRYTKPLAAPTASVELIPLVISSAPEPTGNNPQTAVAATLAPTLELPEVVELFEPADDVAREGQSEPEVLEPPEDDAKAEQDRVEGEAESDDENGDTGEGQEGEDRGQDGSRFGLDEEQWELLTRAVLDNYLEPVAKTDH